MKRKRGRPPKPKPASEPQKQAVPPSRTPKVSDVREPPIVVPDLPTVTEKVPQFIPPAYDLIRPNSIDTRTSILPEPSIKPPHDNIPDYTRTDRPQVYLPENVPLFSGNNVDLKFSDRFHGSIPDKTRTNRAEDTF